MTIPFKNVPSNLRAPLFYGELDASRANTSAQAQRTLIIGQITGAGSAAPNVPIQSLSAAAGKAAGGPGSVLAAMVNAYRAADSAGEVWLLPLADDPNAVAATGTLTFTGPSTLTGLLPLYVAGQLLSIAIAGGQAAAAIATTVAAAINAAIDLPVTATAAAGIVTLTTKNKGLVGNEVDVRVNYLGTPAGEALPPGVGLTIVPMSGGAVNPSLTAGLANLQDEPFDFIVSALTDAVSTAAIKALLSDSSGRWAWNSQVYGHAFMALRATYGQAAAYGPLLNDQHQTVIPFYDSPSPNWEWAADVAGTAAVSLRADPGVPLQYLTLSTVKAPPIASRFPLSVRNQLLFDGCSTFTVDANGNVVLENVTTTYVVNAAGQADDSYLEIETMYLLMYVLRSLRSVITTKYARRKLAADGVRLNPGSAVVTPSTIKADLIANYRELEAEGMVQQSDLFAANLVVEKDATNPNRVNVLYPAVLIDQLRVFASLVQFRLQ